MSNYIYNIFCDESCHLESDGSAVMVLGALMCAEDMRKQHNQNIRELKEKYGISSWNELKWTKVSSGKMGFYEELIDYFLCNSDIKFRACVAPKDKLDHEYYCQTHDEWYYKMYYNLLKKMIGNESYKIYLDIKDTLGGKKVSKLREILAYSHGDYSYSKIKGIYQIRSHESELIQLADLFIGALGYYHRGFYDTSNLKKGKQQIVYLLQRKAAVDFSRTSPYSREKFNIFIWEPNWRVL